MNPINVSNMTLWQLRPDEPDAKASPFLYFETKGKETHLKQEQICAFCGYDPCICNNPELALSQVDFEVVL
jgi:hypothetical protein